MPDSFPESVEARLGAGFNPESDEYNEVVGELLKKKYPLIIPKPPIPDDPTKEKTVEQEGPYAHEAWVWHPEEKDWFKHQASFDIDSGMLLKGMKHKSIDNTIAGEKGYSEIYKADDGYYYRRPIKK